MKFTLTIPQQDVAKAYDQVVQKHTASTTVKGFRKGKAPQKVVIDQVGESKILEDTVQSLLPEAYSKAISQKQLKPITFPQFRPIKVEKNSDWEFEVEIAQKPQVDLKNYQQAIKGALAKEKIWTPGKDQPSAPNQTDSKPSPDQDQKKNIDLIFSTLLSTCEVDVPELLVKEDVDRSLTELVDQVKKLGMSIDDYLKAKGQTAETLRQSYHQQAHESLKLEFILQEITTDLKIEVTDQEVAAALKSSSTSPNPDQKAYVRLLLTRRKTIDRLLALAA